MVIGGLYGITSPSAQNWEVYDNTFYGCTTGIRVVNGNTLPNYFIHDNICCGNDVGIEVGIGFGPDNNFVNNQVINCVVDYINITEPDFTSNGNTISLISPQAILPTNSGYIRMYAPTDCYFLFGTIGVSATTTTATYFEAAAEQLKVPAGSTHIALVQSSDASTAYITGLI